MSGPQTPRPGSTVHVECWCMAKVIRVEVEEVAAGRTGSCGRRACHPPDGNTVLTFG